MSLRLTLVVTRFTQMMGSHPARSVGENGTGLQAQGTLARNRVKILWRQGCDLYRRSQRIFRESHALRPSRHFSGNLPGVSPCRTAWRAFPSSGPSDQPLVDRP
jgi:hypothetical protein